MSNKTSIATQYAYLTKKMGRVYGDRLARHIHLLEKGGQAGHHRSSLGQVQVELGHHDVAGSGHVGYIVILVFRQCHLTLIQNL